MNLESQFTGIILVIIIVILAIVGLWGYFTTENQPQPILELKDGILLVDGNSLLPISPVYLPYVQVLADKIVDCESRGKMVWGDLEKEHPAFGVAQFQRRTFDWLNELRGTTLNYFDEQDQRSMLYWAISNGYGELWTCWDLIEK
jgi:hypothetical protein